MAFLKLPGTPRIQSWSASPVVVGLEPVHAYRRTVDAGLEQRVKPPAVQQHTVRDNTPRKTHVVDGPSTRDYVGAHQRLPACNYDEDFMRIVFFGYTAQDPGEILERHVFY